MDLPDFIRAMPELDLPFPASVVTARAVRSETALVVFFEFHEAMDLPAHSHGAQWGTVLEGEIEMTIGAATRVFRPGESFSIPAGTTHSARIPAGTKMIDVFEEPGRYPLKG